MGRLKFLIIPLILAVSCAPSVKIYNYTTIPTVLMKGRKPGAKFEVDAGMKLGSTFAIERGGDFSVTTDGVSGIFLRIIPTAPLVLNFWSTGSSYGGDIRVAYVHPSFLISPGIGFAKDSLGNNFPYLLLGGGKYIEETFVYFGGFYVSPKVHTRFEYSGHDTSYIKEDTHDGEVMGVVAGVDYHISKRVGFTSEAAYVSFKSGIRDFKWSDEDDSYVLFDRKIDDLKVILGFYWRF